jgi:DNA polymerase III delta subunit
MLDRTSIKKNKKFLINCSDSYMANMFIEECKAIYSDYIVKMCFNTKEFIEGLNGGYLFNSDKKILALMNFSDDNIQDIEPFLDYETEDIIILVEHSALKKNKAYIKIKSDYAYQKLEDMSDKECRSWLHTFMTKMGLKFSPEIPSYIINKRGTDPRALVNEVKKLKYLDKEVTEPLCSSIVCDSYDSNFFELMDNFSHKRMEQCLKEFNKIDESKYIQLLHFIISQFEKLYKITIYREQKKSSEEISELINVPRFIVQTKLYTAISIFNKVKILKVIDLLNSLDVQLRLSKYSNKLIFESYILKIFNL